MTELTNEQKSQLDALMADLEKLSTPELIRESGRLRLPQPFDEAGKQRIRLAYAGAISAQKLLAYIQTLREVNQRSGELGYETHQKLKQARMWRAMRSLDAALPETEALYLSGQQ